MVQLATAFRDSRTAQIPEQDTVDLFHRSFSAEVADTDELRKEVYRLRYQVYCSERGFEDPGRFVAGLEADCYDKRAYHALVRHKKSDLVVGVVRLISRDGLGVSSFLPIEEASAHVFDLSLIERFDHTSPQVAEVSRFAVSKKVVAEALRTADGAMTPDVQLLSVVPTKLIAWGLIALLFRMSQDTGTEHWMALMERSLARHLSRLGIDFHKIGPVIDYHGKRQPMMASVEDLLSDIKHRRPDFYRLIRSVVVGDQSSSRSYHSGDLRFRTRVFV